jgi:hypothetical protein
LLDRDKHCLGRLPPPESTGDIAKIGSALSTQYDRATRVAATAGGYTGFDSDDLVRLR